MESKTCLKAALRHLRDLESKEKEELRPAVKIFAQCQWLCFEQNDEEGFFWSMNLLKGIVYVCLGHQAPEGIFGDLLEDFKAIQMVESPVALASFYVASHNEHEIARETVAVWYRKCLDAAKTEHLKYHAAIRLGRSLAKQPSDALEWFLLAQQCARTADSRTIATYYVAKCLASLGKDQEASLCLEKSGMFASVLQAILDVQIKGFSEGIVPHELLSDYSKARCQLVENFMVNLHKELSDFVSATCFSRFCLIKFIRLDKFSRHVLLTYPLGKETQHKVPVENYFSAYEIYRDTRYEMIGIEEKFGLECCSDPRPRLEQAIEYIHSHVDKERVLALDPLVISHQIASKAACLSGLDIAGRWLLNWVGNRGYTKTVPSEGVASRFLASFPRWSTNREVSEAWGNYYLGRSALIQEVTDIGPELNRLEKCLEMSNTPMLGYYVSWTLSSAQGQGANYQKQLDTAEVMKECAIRTGIEEMIIDSMIGVFDSLIQLKKFGRAKQLQEELLEMSHRFSSHGKLAKGVSEYMEGYLLDGWSDNVQGRVSWQKALHTLQPLAALYARSTLFSYLENVRDWPSSTARTCFQIVYDAVLNHFNR